MDILRRTDVTLGPLLTTFILGLVTFVLLLWHSFRKHSYWKKIGIPYVKPYPFFGSLLDNIRTPLHDTELERYNKHGRIYGYYEGNRACLSVGDPKILRNILVKDFQAFSGRRKLDIGDKIIDSQLSTLHGEDWKRVRTILTPTFTTGKLKRMMSIFKECSQTLVQNFKEATERGNLIEVKTIYGAFSLDTIASAAFSTKIDSHNDSDNAFATAARKFFTVNVNWRMIILFLMPRVMKVFRISIMDPKIMKFFTDVIIQIIEERKRTGEKRNDFLQLLMDTVEELSEEGKLDLDENDDITKNYGEDENREIFKPAMLTKKTLSQEELVSQCLVFFLGGYATTSTTLSFASYLLALHPEIQERLIEEVDNALRENNGELTYEAVQNMKYLDNVISETLRLYAPAIKLERVADVDYKLGDTGLVVPKGMLVTVPVYAIHRDPDFFPDPEKFDPDRFTPEEREKRDQCTYIPFGYGPRNCVGMRFALIAVKVCLAYVLTNFRIKRCPQTKVPLDWFIGQGLLQPKDINLSMEVRKDTVKAT